MKKRQTGFGFDCLWVLFLFIKHHLTRTKAYLEQFHCPTLRCYLLNISNKKQVLQIGVGRILKERQRMKVRDRKRKKEKNEITNT